MEEIKIHKTEKAKKFGITIQPYIIFIGPTKLDVQLSYIAIDGNYIKLESVLKTIDICFKSFFAFNLKYPNECYSIWLFIQHYFYKIKTKTDKQFQKIDTLINELNQI